MAILDASNVINKCWLYFVKANHYLNKCFDPNFLIGIATLMVSILIPISIMILDSKGTDNNRDEAQWTKLVAKNEIMNLHDVIIYVLGMIMGVSIQKIFPAVSLLSLFVFVVCYYKLVKIMWLYVQWINSNGLNIDILVEKRKKLLQSNDYDIDDQSFNWSVFLRYAENPTNTSKLLNPDIFYNMWLKAASRYSDFSSPEFVNFSGMLCQSFSKLQLRFVSPFYHDFYKQCLERSFQRNGYAWNQLAKVQLQYVQNKVKKEQFSLSFNQLMRVLQELVETHSDNQNYLSKLDNQYLSCLFVMKDPLDNISNRYECFQITMEKLQRNDIKAIILMNTFFSKVNNDSLTNVKLSKESFNNDERFSYLFPKADMITLGRLNHLYNVYRYYSSGSSGFIWQAINLLKNDLAFGYSYGKVDIFEGNVDNQTMQRYTNAKVDESVSIFIYYLKQLNQLSYYSNKTQSLLTAFQSEKVNEFISKSEKSDFYEIKRKSFVFVLKQMKKKLSSNN